MSATRRSGAVSPPAPGAACAAPERSGPSPAARLCASLGILAAAFLGCKAVDAVVSSAADAARDAGVIKKEDAESIKRTSAAFRESAKEFTDSEEHYIGRSVAAQIYMHYRPSANAALVRYLQTVGQVVAQASERPETYGGYHFELLESDEINAFAAPGGFVFMTTGLLSLCEDEDMLAAVLAHEVAHVYHKHGLQAISKGRLAQAFGILTGEAMQVLTDHQASELAQTLQGSVSDITGALFESGYGKAAEKEADTGGTLYSARAGFDPSGLERVLVAMQRRQGVAQGGFFKTHPKVEDRLEVVREVLEDEKLSPIRPLDVRCRRFHSATGRA